MSTSLFFGGISISNPAGTVINGSTKVLRFLGSVAVAQVGGETQITVGAGANLNFQDEGVAVGSFGTVNFVGAGVTVVENPAGVAEVTITAPTPTGNPNRVAFFDSLGALSDSDRLQYIIDGADSKLTLGNLITIIPGIGLNSFVFGTQIDLAVNPASNSIIGGSNTDIRGLVNSAAIGTGNIITSVSESAIFGESHQITDSTHLLVSGESNDLADTTHCLVTGSGNVLNGLPGVDRIIGCEVGGLSNTLERGTNTCLVFGVANALDIFSTATIVGGQSNIITSPVNSAVFGENNTIDSVLNSMISGRGNTCSHNDSALLGQNLNSTVDRGTVVGLDNDTNYVSDDTTGDYFNVGTGGGTSGFGVGGAKRLVKSAKPQTEVSAQILAAGFTIATDNAANTGFIEISAAGPVSSDGASAIQTGYPGQHLYLVNTGANDITLQNGAGILLPGAVNLTLGQRDTLTLIYSATLASWVTLATSNN